MTTSLYSVGMYKEEGEREEYTTNPNSFSLQRKLFPSGL